MLWDILSFSGFHTSNGAADEAGQKSHKNRGPAPVRIAAAVGKRPDGKQPRIAVTRPPAGGALAASRPDSDGATTSAG